MPILTNLEIFLGVWFAVQSLAIPAWIRTNRKLRDMNDATIADLRGQIERMMDSAIDSDAGDRLWAARRPAGACARKLAAPPEGTD